MSGRTVHFVGHPRAVATWVALGALGLVSLGGPAASEPVRGAAVPVEVPREVLAQAPSFATTGGLEVASRFGATAVSAGANAEPVVDVRYGEGFSFAFLAEDVRFRGGIRVAFCDVDGDRRPEVITGAGPGGGPRVAVFNGTEPAPAKFAFFAYDPGFRAGVFVACGDVDGDGLDDIVTGAGAGGGPNVRVFDGRNGTLKASFFAEDPRFTGGIRVAALPGGGIVTGAGPGGGPAVRTFTAGGVARAGAFCFDPAYNGGVTVTAGDVTGDSAPEVICGSATGTSNVVTLTSGLQRPQGMPAFFATFGGATSNGVRIAAVERSLGIVELVAAPGPGRAGTTASYTLRPPAGGTGPALELQISEGLAPTTTTNLIGLDGSALGQVPPGLRTPTGLTTPIPDGRSPLDDILHHGRRDGTGLVRTPTGGRFLARADVAPVVVGFRQSTGGFFSARLDGTPIAQSPQYISPVDLDHSYDVLVSDDAKVMVVSDSVRGFPGGTFVLRPLEPGMPAAGLGSIPASAPVENSFERPGTRRDLSPDGRSYAVCEENDQHRGVTIFDTTTKEVRRIATDGCRVVRFSPTGDRLLVANGPTRLPDGTRDPLSTRSGLIVVRADGTGTATQVATPNADVLTAEWTADGGSVAYVTPTISLQTSGRRVSVSGLDGSAPRTVIERDHIILKRALPTT